MSKIIQESYVSFHLVVIRLGDPLPDIMLLPGNQKRGLPEVTILMPTIFPSMIFIIYTKQKQIYCFSEVQGWLASKEEDREYFALATEHCAMSHFEECFWVSLITDIAYRKTGFGLLMPFSL